MLLLASLGGCGKQTGSDGNGRKLSIIVKSDQTIAQGDTDDVLVTVVRSEMKGAVEVSFSNLPTGVSVTNPGPVLAAESMHTFHLAASATAPAIEDRKVVVTATLNGVEVSEGFNLSVKSKQ